MANFVLIAVCIIAGMIFKATKSIHPDAHKGINTWILYLLFRQFHSNICLKFNGQQKCFSDCCYIFNLCVLFFFMMFYSKSRGYSRRSRSTLELASGYSNTSFIGFPLICFLWRKSFEYCHYL
jgi:predicted permease